MFTERLNNMTRKHRDIYQMLPLEEQVKIEIPQAKNIFAVSTIRMFGYIF